LRITAPAEDPAFGGFPWNTLIELGVGVGAFARDVWSGFQTEGIRQIIDASEFPSATSRPEQRAQRAEAAWPSWTRAPSRS
jgi:hypothetical protein